MIPFKRKLDGIEIMRIHPEGYSTLALGGGLLALANVAGYALLPRKTFYGLAATSGLGLAGLAGFFRDPQRPAPQRPDAILAPADGVIVNIERVRETEYFNDERLLVSIFLSVFNVHINWIPVNGRVSYYQYHAGQYLVAFHPKSSELNERSTVVIESDNGIPILTRQIAGLLARRIKTYVAVGQRVEAGQELGFIKFGSRMDIFLPPDSALQVAQYQTVVGGQTILTEL